MSLTGALMVKAKPREKGYKLYDSHCLALLVAPTGSRWWRFNYRFGGKQKTLSLGVWPNVTLGEARKIRDDMRAKLNSGGDPSEERREVKRNTIKQNNFIFRMTLVPSGDLTIMTRTRTITLNPAQTKALRAFLNAASTENQEIPC
jgi:hypothetical protein